MILFLDFDGVLHPQPYDNGDEFCLRSLFERVARDYEGLQIVISSSWRQEKHNDISRLRSYFSDNVAAMIIDVTPDHLQLPTDFAPELAPYPRQREIAYWCEQHGVAEGDWIALDDDPELFAPDCQHLILCDPQWGLTEFDVARLRAVFSNRLGSGRYLAP